MDSAGNLYGTTSSGGANGLGTVFELARGSSSIKTLVSFDGVDGAHPGGVVMDAAGDLYGTTADYTPNFPYGTVFELIKGSNTITTLTAFTQASGYDANGVTLSQSGSIYGTTFLGGGGVYELTPNTAVTVALTSGTNPSPANTQVTYTATVSGGVPDGETVTIEDTSNNDAFVASGSLVSGSATLTILPNTLSVGTHNLIVVYGGDATHANSISTPFTQIVTASTTRPGRGP